MSSKSGVRGLKINSPLPKDLAGECKKASKILNSFVDPIAAKGIDNIIPSDILAKAKGLAIFTVIKAGFLFSGRAGSGLVVARLDDGTWSAPSAIGTGGMGFGGQIGAELTDFVIVLNNRAAVKSFSSGGNVTLGGNLSVAAGPIGRTAEAGASASVKSVAAIYSYSKSKGLFAGVSIEGSIIVERKDANETFYRRPVSASELLNGEVSPPPQADILYRALNSKAMGYQSYNRAMGNGDESLYGDNHSSQGSYYDSNINRSASVASPGRYGSPTLQRDQEESTGAGYSGLGRSATSAGGYSVNAARSAATTNAYSTDTKPKAFEARSSTGADDYNDPVPRYTPLAGAPATKPKPGAYSAASASTLGRLSSDNNSPFNGAGAQTHMNQTIANTSGPRIPPKIGAKPDLVTALYDFAGEQATDLSFKKGDLITVIKKTPNRNDWWTGRLQGREGSFPANYTQ